LAGRVLLKIVYLPVRRILGLAVLMLRGQGAKEAELLVLRHENAVLRLCVPRIASTALTSRVARPALCP
jgi:hypothetical protein